MREIALFVEDHAHQQVIGALLNRIAKEFSIEIKLQWRNAIGGQARVNIELDDYLSDLTRQGSPWPDLLIVATDANCQGLNERTRTIRLPDIPVSIILAIPDPHIERWLLLDGAAFKAVFGRGCSAPDQKCSRNRYKHLLTEAIRATGLLPYFGGVEFAEDILRHMDIDRAARMDISFRRFVEDLRHIFRRWQSSQTPS